MTRILLSFGVRVGGVLHGGARSPPVPSGVNGATLRFPRGRANVRAKVSARGGVGRAGDPCAPRDHCRGCRSLESAAPSRTFAPSPAARRPDRHTKLKAPRLRDEATPSQLIGHRGVLPHAPGGSHVAGADRRCAWPHSSLLFCGWPCGPWPRWRGGGRSTPRVRTPFSARNGPILARGGQLTSPASCSVGSWRQACTTDVQGRLPWPVTSSSPTRRSPARSC